MFFSKCHNTEEAKAQFKALASFHHPAKGGAATVWAKINAEYRDFLTAQGQNAPAQPEAQEATPKPAPEAPEATDEQTKEAEEKEMQDAITFAKSFDDLTVELVGTWLWVTGNTLKHWPQLKAAGFFYASKKQCCYFRTASNRVYKKNGKQLELHEIKTKYGAKQL